MEDVEGEEQTGLAWKKIGHGVDYKIVGPWAQTWPLGLSLVGLLGNPSMPMMQGWV